MISPGFALRDGEAATASVADRAAVERLDARLAELARGSGRARLVLGESLELLARQGGHHELGFSSLDAYARERCGRSGRWALESRTLARRLAQLPLMRAALASGALGWCMTELVARHAAPDTEAELLDRALCSTVRQMRTTLGQMSACDPDEADERCTLTLLMSRPDAWLFGWTRRFAEHMGARPDADGAMSALLGEAFDTLCGALPSNDVEACVEAEPHDEAAWRAQLAAWRIEAERRSEASFTERGPGGGNPVSLPDLRALGIRQLDARIAELSATFGREEVEFARAALALHQADGARRLGYASEAQYARERLGLSHASFKAKVALARRGCARVRGALEQGEIGHEAALLISRVATVETADAWVARARGRTVKHLHEEVRAVELVRGVGGPATPPTDELMRELHELEARWLGGEREAVLARGSQMSARSAPKLGMVQVRLRVTGDTARFYRTLEAVVRRHLPRNTSFVRLLCDLFWDAWKHTTQRSEAYAHIYARDRYTCSSPVCSRHDVTPHHVKFRATGGGDEDENVIALCTWCHLEGVHGGRIQVTGQVGELSWKLGGLSVHGRARRARPWRRAA